MDIAKVAVIAVASCVLVLLLKQNRPEFSIFVQLCCIAVVVGFCLDAMRDVFETASSMLKNTEVSIGYFRLLIKALSTAVVTHIAGDICRDSGNSALAGTVELAGKTIILSLALPIITALAEIGFELIKE